MTASKVSSVRQVSSLSCFDWASTTTHNTIDITISTVDTILNKLRSTEVFALKSPLSLWPSLYALAADKDIYIATAPKGMLKQRQTSVERVRLVSGICRTLEKLLSETLLFFSPGFDVGGADFSEFFSGVGYFIKFALAVLSGGLLSEDPIIFQMTSQQPSVPSAPNVPAPCDYSVTYQDFRSMNRARLSMKHLKRRTQNERGTCIKRLFWPPYEVKK